MPFAERYKMRLNLAVLGVCCVGLAMPAYANSNSSDICRKVGSVISNHLDSIQDIGLSLTTMRIVGEAKERERAEQTFLLLKSSTDELIKGLKEITALCSEQ